MINPIGLLLKKLLITRRRKPVNTNNPLTSAIDKDIDLLAGGYLQKTDTVGLCIGIIKQGAISTYSYGETKKGNGQLPDADSIFEIGSVTKTFTATLLGWFVVSGQISLDDPITKYLPDDVVKANAALEKIKVVNLANHTSGLARLPDNFALRSLFWINPYKNYNDRMLFSALKNTKLRSTPVEKYAYSNYAFGLLGVILERISGKTFEELVKDIITGPLKMESTGQHLPDEHLSRFVKVYNGMGIQVKPWDFDALAACGALRSTINDLLTYAKANMATDNVMLAKAFELTHQITFIKTPKIGLGWHLLSWNDVSYHWHNGGTYGCRSFLLFNAEKELAIAVLSNSAVGCDKLAVNILKKLQ